MYGSKNVWDKKLFPIINHVDGDILPYENYDAAKITRRNISKEAISLTKLLASEFSKIKTLHDIFLWPTNYEAEIQPMADTLIMTAKKCISEIKHRIKRYTSLTRQNKIYGFCEEFKYLNKFLFSGSSVYGFQYRVARRALKCTEDEMDENDHDDLPAEPLHLVQFSGIPAIIVENIPNLYENVEVNVRDFF